MRRQRPTRRCSCTTLALRSSRGSTGGSTTGRSTLSVGAGGSASDFSSEAVMESDRSRESSSSGAGSGGGGTAIASSPGSPINSGSSSAGMTDAAADGSLTGGTDGKSSAAAAPDAGATPGISALILSQTSGGGSTASTMTLSSPSRRSHCLTNAAKCGSSDIKASACSRSSAVSVPSTYSAASAS